MQDRKLYQKGRNQEEEQTTSLDFIHMTTYDPKQCKINEISKDISDNKLKRMFTAGREEGIKLLEHRMQNNALDLEDVPFQEVDTNTLKAIVNGFYHEETQSE